MSSAAAHLFLSAAQERENLIHKMSILLQAEIYKLALFLKDYKDRLFWLEQKKEK